MIPLFRYDLFNPGEAYIRKPYPSFEKFGTYTLQVRSLCCSGCVCTRVCLLLWSDRRSGVDGGRSQSRGVSHDMSLRQTATSSFRHSYLSLHEGQNKVCSGLSRISSSHRLLFTLDIQERFLGLGLGF